jgi:hypothetical protein
MGDSINFIGQILVKPDEFRTTGDKPKSNWDLNMYVLKIRANLACRHSFNTCSVFYFVYLKNENYPTQHKPQQQWVVKSTPIHYGVGRLNRYNYGLPYLALADQFWIFLMVVSRSFFRNICLRCYVLDNGELYFRISINVD